MSRSSSHDPVVVASLCDRIFFFVVCCTVKGLSDRDLTWSTEQQKKKNHLCLVMIQTWTTSLTFRGQVPSEGSCPRRLPSNQSAAPDPISHTHTHGRRDDVEATAGGSATVDVDGLSAGSGRKHSPCLNIAAPPSDCPAHSTESYRNKVHPLISNWWGHNNDGELKLLLSNVPSVSGEEGVIQTCFCCLPAHLCFFLEKSWEEVINRWQHWSVRPTDVYVWRVKRTVHHYSQHFQWKM